jgi:argininosuccinate synthase
MKKVVLAYSGGLDTSLAVKWLNDQGLSVIAYLADVGQGLDKKKITQKAQKAGAEKVVIEDLRNEFIDSYIMPALKANAVYEGKYFLATALSRPLIAKGVVQTAKEEKAEYVAHGCTGKGNDQVRFELTFNSLAPELEIIAPLREWEFESREEQIDYCQKHKITFEATKKSPYSIDKNLWGVSIECGALEDPLKAPPEEAFILTNSLQKAPTKPEKIKIHFEKGLPVKLNGKKTAAITLIDKLNKIGGKHAVGRSDLIENRFIGIKSREIYEAPAAAILTLAHKELEALAIDRETLHFKGFIEKKLSELIYNGLYFTPLKEALEAFINKTQKYVTGVIEVELYKGNISVLSRDSKYSLYSKKLATYSKEDIFNRKAAEGFIKILGLPYKQTGRRK